MCTHDPFEVFVGGHPVPHAVRSAIPSLAVRTVERRTKTTRGSTPLWLLVRPCWGRPSEVERRDALMQHLGRTAARCQPTTRARDALRASRVGCVDVLVGDGFEHEAVQILEEGRVEVLAVL